MSGRARIPADSERPRSAAPPATRPTDAREAQAATSDVATAPPIVHEALAGPSTALDAATSAELGTRLGCDLSRVRVHSDERAATSAEAVGALAYTVGQDVVFGRGRYAPHTPAGRALLAHELAHVAQDGADGATSEIDVGRADDPAEREAERAAARAIAPARGPGTPRGPDTAHDAARPARPRGDHAAAGRARSRVLRRSLLGTILGGAAGLIGGVVLGALAGGLGGAILGGVGGLLVGGAIGNSATTRSRSLTSEETTEAREVFAESLDYTQVEITRGSVFAVGAARTIGNTIHLEAGHFVGDTLELSAAGRTTLIHEMGHVWQYQNGGLAYIPESILAQLRYGRSTGPGSAYDWRGAHDAGKPWSEWNPEQQAQAIQTYNDLLHKQKAGTATLDDLHVLSILLAYIELVRRGEGAPAYGVAPDPGNLLRGSADGGTP